MPPKSCFTRWIRVGCSRTFRYLDEFQSTTTSKNSFSCEVHLLKTCFLWENKSFCTNAAFSCFLLQNSKSLLLQDKMIESIFLFTTYIVMTEQFFFFFFHMALQFTYSKNDCHISNGIGIDLHSTNTFWSWRSEWNVDTGDCFVVENTNSM